MEGVNFAVPDFVLQTVSAFGGKIEGKTLLQKRVYFAGVLCRALPRLEYRAHFYGPYSGAVDVALGRLCKLDFLSQSEDDVPVSSNGLEVKRYSYTLTSDGKEIAEPDDDNQAAIALRNAVQAACDAIKKAGDLDATELSIAAKTYFLLGERGGSAWTHEVAELAGNFNWNITPKQVEDAAQFLQKLKVAQLS